MLVRTDDHGVLAIGQASHAWLSGQLAHGWGNDRFDRPDPADEVCLAAEQHDVAMSEWDLAPRIEPASGRPQSFMEMSIDDHLRLWSRAPDKLVTQSRYAALLVSMHGSALYERREPDRMSTADAAAVREYLAREADRQERLIEALGADRSQLRRNQRLVFAWDGLSLALCLGWGDHVATEVPAKGGESADIRLRPLGEKEAGRFALEPWPLAAPEWTVRCEGRRLGRRYATEEELRPALEAAPSVALVFTLCRPGADEP